MCLNTQLNCVRNIGWQRRMRCILQPLLMRVARNFGRMIGVLNTQRLDF